MGNERVVRTLNKAVKGVLELAEYYTKKVDVLETQLEYEKTNGDNKIHRLIDEIRQIVYRAPIDDVHLVIDDIVNKLEEHDKRTRAEQVEASRQAAKLMETVFDHKGIRFGE